MAERMPLKIFIASSSELKEEREKCISVVNELNKVHKHLFIEAVEFEHDLPAGNFPGHETVQKGINPKLLECDCAVFIFYSKIGTYTREEFDLTKANEKKFFAYFKKGFPPDLDTIDQYKELLDFKKTLNEPVLYSEYNDVIGFDSHLYKNLNLYLSEKYPSENDDDLVLISSSKQYIPLPPRPYVAHPYNSTRNFTGRTEEMRNLSKWFYFDQNPICIVEAIGGLGKSAMAWKWLQDEIIKQPEQTEGIVWWSFYDQSFEDFIKHLFQYCIPQSERIKPGTVDETTALLSILKDRKFLIIMDGHERALRAFSQIKAMYIQEEGLSNEEKKELEKFQRSSINAKGDRFLKQLSSLQSKVLITTRLFPQALDKNTGVCHLKLTGFSNTDTIQFFKKENIEGLKDDMIKAGETYSNHPLLLKLLTSAINRSNTTDIQNAFSSKLIDEKDPKNILQTVFELLTETEKKVATVLSVFRTSFSFDAAQAVFPDMAKYDLEKTLTELYRLGVIFYQEEENLYDFHPILRSFLYDQLTSPVAIHELVFKYFEKIPPKEKIISIDDLKPVIEQYYHLINAKREEDAYNVYLQRISQGLLYQFPQPYLMIELLSELFDPSTDKLPRLEKPRHQSTIINELALSYLRIGQLKKADELFFMSCIIDHKYVDYELSVGLFNIASSQTFQIEFASSLVHLDKAGDISTESDDFTKAICNISKSGILLYQDKFSIKGEKYLKLAYKTFNETQNWNSVSQVKSLYAKTYLNNFRLRRSKKTDLNNALKYGIQALKYTEMQLTENYPHPRTFIECYLTIAEILLYFGTYRKNLPIDGININFYDENFQNITETVNEKKLPLLSIIERCLSESLIRSRKINFLEFESMSLLLNGRLQWLKIKDTKEKALQINEVVQHIEEAKFLAEKSEFNLHMVDIHIFCAEFLIDLIKIKPDISFTVLDHDTKQHLALAKKYSLDNSTVDKLFLPTDDLDFYKDIPEYDMIKDGLTEKQKIENGYYVGWQIADMLEKQL